MNNEHTRTLAGVTTTDEYAYVVPGNVGGQHAAPIGSSTQDRRDDDWLRDFEAALAAEKDGVDTMF